MKNGIAAIFDMDGVIVNNHDYHYEAWMQFCKKHDRMISREKFLGYFGGSSQEILEGVFEGQMTTEEIAAFADEKEAMYREIYRPHLKILNGLPEFLRNLNSNNIPAAIATSAPLANAEFVIREGGLTGLFSTIVHDAMIKNLKPHPDIYFKASELLGYAPSQCIVFEDSYRGIEAAQKAGMRVVGVATTNSPDKISYTDYVIKDFSEINIDKIYELLGTEPVNRNT